MKSKLLSGGDQKTYALIFDTGDEVTATLLDFARQHEIGDAHFTAIRAHPSRAGQRSHHQLL